MHIKCPAPKAANRFSHVLYMFQYMMQPWGPTAKQRLKSEGRDTTAPPLCIIHFIPRLYYFVNFESKSYKQNKGDNNLAFNRETCIKYEKGSRNSFFPLFFISRCLFYLYNLIYPFDQQKLS